MRDAAATFTPGLAIIMTVPDSARGVARVVKLTPDGAGEKHAGMAFILDERHVMTCCHVLNFALDRRNVDDRERPPADQRFSIRFPFASDAKGSGVVVRWGFEHSKDRDIAVLELEEAAPDEAGVAVFSEAEGGGEQWICTGYNADGVNREVRGDLGSILPSGDLQLNMRDGVAPRIIGGYSGAAVWSRDFEAYVGMVKSLDCASHENGIGLAIPGRDLKEVWPGLRTRARCSTEESDAKYQAIASLVNGISQILRVVEVRDVGGSAGVDVGLRTEPASEDLARLHSGAVELIPKYLAEAGPPRGEDQVAIRAIANAMLFYLNGCDEEASAAIEACQPSQRIVKLRTEIELELSLLTIRAKVESRRGDWKRAIEALASARELRRDDPDILMQLFHCHVAYANHLQKDKAREEEALRHAQEAKLLLSLHPGSRDFLVRDLNFAGTPAANGIPEGWHPFPHWGKSQIGVVRQDAGEPSLKIETNSSSMAVYRGVTIDLEKTPILTWEWRAGVLPERGDVRGDGTDDQACQVLLALKFDGFQFCLLNYIWDTNAPIGTTFVRKMPPAGFFKMFYLVVRSGAPAPGQWHRERRDIRADLLKIVSEHGRRSGFGEDVIPFSIKGVAVQGNSQHSGGRSIGLFRSIQCVSKDLGACFSMIPGLTDDPPTGV